MAGTSLGLFGKLTDRTSAVAFLAGPGANCIPATSILLEGGIGA